eukprot:2721052-Prymnesium_polylepis.1
MSTHAGGGDGLPPLTNRAADKELKVWSAFSAGPAVLATEGSGSLGTLVILLERNAFAELVWRTLSS